MIELIKVSKKIKKQLIFESVSMQLEPGNIYGIVGANGCGKTVLLRVIIGLVKPTTGKVLYNGQKLGEKLKILPSVGVILEKPVFYNELSAVDNLMLLAKIRNIINKEQVSETIAKVGLNPSDNKPVGKYSLGMTQRLGLAQALMENPDILILDEPTNALDERGIKLIHQLIKAEKNNNKLVIITSHSKYDIAELCDQVYTFNDGSVYKNES